MNNWWITDDLNLDLYKHYTIEQIIECDTLVENPEWSNSVCKFILFRFKYKKDIINNLSINTYKQILSYIMNDIYIKKTDRDLYGIKNNLS